MTLVFLTGSEALKCVKSEKFQSKWKSLYAHCPWVTACQHPNFVAPWYEFYYTLFLPVVIFNEDDDQSLNWLLTLALNHKENKLTGAGERQAEYHGWIESPNTHNDFIWPAIEKIRARFPGVDLVFKYLPPGIPLNWIGDKGNNRKLCSLRSHSRPVMKIDEAAMDRQRTKKNNRQNYNRLKKLGDVQFEKVIEHDHFIQIFDELCIQYDFRQGALYQNMPFSSDPMKKLFYITLHKNGLLHTTILTVDGEIAASHSGLLSEGHAVHLGINTHAPAFAVHSPGNLLLAMLGVQLAQEKIPLLDLTPGGDVYKENFATTHDAAFELIIYSDIKTRLRNEVFLGVMRFMKTRLRAAGYRTADIFSTFCKIKNLRVPVFHGLLGKLHGQSTAKYCKLRHFHNLQIVNKKELTISKNSLNDILKFDSCNFSMTNWEFFGTVMKRMERSQHLFTFVDNDKLLVYCWIKMCSSEPASQPSVGSLYIDSPIVLFDLYVHDQLGNAEIAQLFICQILYELKKIKTNTIYYSGYLSRELQSVIKRCGFADESVGAMIV